MNICVECLAYPSAPDSYISVKGVLVPNSAYNVWEAEHKSYLDAKRQKSNSETVAG